MPIYDIHGNKIEVSGGSGTFEISNGLKYVDDSVINKSWNLNDEVYERGHFNATTGEEVEHENTFRNKNYLPVDGGRKIAVYGEMLDGSLMYTTVYIVEYDADKNIILCSNIRPFPATKSMNCVFTLQENTAYIRLSQNYTYSYYDTSLARITIVYEEHFALTNFSYEPYYFPTFNPSEISKPKKVTILGDSYSTYSGWIPEGYEAWYNEGDDSKGISDVSQTWWYKLIKDNDLRLVMNSSYSGSTISNMGRAGGIIDYSFIKRMVNDLGAGRVEREKPDLILIMGGLNDVSSPSELGEVKYSDWVEEDLNMVLPAFCYMLDYIKKFNPNAKIVNCVVYGLSTDMKTGMETACEHYGVYYCPLCNLVSNSAVVSGHPDEFGHSLLKNDIEAFLRKNNLI